MKGENQMTEKTKEKHITAWVALAIGIMTALLSSTSTYFISQAGQDSKINNNWNQIENVKEDIDMLNENIKVVADQCKPENIAVMENEMKNIRETLRTFMSDYKKDKQQEQKFYRNAAAKLGFTFDGN